MKCPNCETTLVMTERQGVEIDHCPQCRGVWLDRGELDKIIERSARFDDSRDEDRDDRGRPRSDDYGRQPPPPPYRGDDDRNRYYHKKKSFWSELFD